MLRTLRPVWTKLPSNWRAWIVEKDMSNEGKIAGWLSKIAESGRIVEEHEHYGYGTTITSHAFGLIKLKYDWSETHPCMYVVSCMGKNVLQAIWW